MEKAPQAKISFMNLNPSHELTSKVSEILSPRKGIICSSDALTRVPTPISVIWMLENWKPEWRINVLTFSVLYDWEVSLHIHSVVFTQPLCLMQRVKELYLSALCTVCVLISPTTLSPLATVPKSSFRSHTLDIPHCSGEAVNHAVFPAFPQL